MISLHEGSLAQFLPALLLVQGLGSFEGDLDVGALEGQRESRLLILKSEKWKFYSLTFLTFESSLKNLSNLRSVINLLHSNLFPKLITETTLTSLIGFNWKAF